ncbi:hypothetical protein [Brevibacillus panacihumi]|uniref:hypothetical protein n=1 Tax=Brevibacillus panacihumi TaxID=497735 RepID=UPI003D1B31B5
MSLKKKMSAFAVMSTLALNAFVVPAFAAINVSDSNITNLTVNTDTELNVSGTTSVTGSVNLKAKTTITPSGDKVDFSKSTLTLAPTENSTFDLGGVKTNKIVIGSDFVTTVNGFVAPTSGVESAPGVTQKPEFTDVSGNPADPVIKPQPDQGVDTKAIDDAISAANSAKQGVAISEDGKDVAPTSKWVTKEVSDALDAAIAKAEAAKGTVKTEDEVAAAASELDAAVQTYNEAKQDGTKASTVPEVRVEAHTVADTEGTAVTGTYNDGTFTIGHDFTKLTLEKGGAPEEAKWVGVYIEGPEGATKAAKLVIVGTNEKSFDNVEFETETGFEKGFFYFFAAQEDGNSNELTITWADKDGATVGVEKLKVVYVNTSN